MAIQPPFNLSAEVILPTTNAHTALSESCTRVNSKCVVSGTSETDVVGTASCTP